MKKDFTKGRSTIHYELCKVFYSLLINLFANYLVFLQVQPTYFSLLFIMFIDILNDVIISTLW